MIDNLFFSINKRNSPLLLQAALFAFVLFLGTSSFAIAQTPEDDSEQTTETEDAAPAAEEESAPTVEEKIEDAAEDTAEDAAAKAEDAAEDAATKKEDELSDELNDLAGDAQKEIDASKSGATTDLEKMGTESEDALMMSTEGLGVAPSVDSSDAEATVSDAVSDANKSAFGATVILDNSVGIGSFVEGSSQRPAYTVSLDMRPTWTLSEKQSLRFRLVVYQGVVQNADSSTTTKRQTLINDLEVRFNHVDKSEMGRIKLTMNPYGSVVAPTSMASRYTNKYGALRAGYSLSGNVDWFTLNLDSVVTKNFNRYTSPTVDKDDGVAVVRLNGAEDLGDSLTAIGGNNVEWSWSNRATTSFSLSDTLTLGITYVFLRSWTYVSYPDDEFTQSSADAGRGERDLVQGVTDIYWQTPIKGFALDAGISSAQAPLSADNSSIRFPFFDTKSAANNYTSVYLSAYYSF